MHNKLIRGTATKHSVGRPTGFHNPTDLIGGVPRAVPNVKGGPNLGGRSGTDFFMGKGASGHVSIRGGQK